MLDGKEDQSAAYWDRVAPIYDDLYKDKWSKLEDSQLEFWLSHLLKRTDRILDLACGTGLGYEICRRTQHTGEYRGIDISKGMLEVFQRKWPNVNVAHGSMDDLSAFRAGEFDVVMALNTSLSFCNDAVRTLAEVHRVLRPGGRVCVSVLNKLALRRLLRLRFGKVEHYNTRHDITNGFTVIANTFSTHQILQLTRNAGFTSQEVHGQSILGGVCQSENFWRLDSAISARTSMFCHQLVITGCKL